MLITLDGLSGTGKSSVASLLASKLNLTSISSGDYFRSIAYYLVKNNINVESIDYEALKTLKIKRIDTRVFLNDEDITIYLKTPEINVMSARIANIKEIQDIVDHLEKSLMTERTIIDGRDVNVRFPNADYSFYLTASVDERVKRMNSSKEEVNSRDHWDLLGNIRKSNKLIEINTDSKSIEEITNEIINIIGE
jgi:cytidylate kinase